MSSRPPCPHCGSITFFEDEGLTVCARCGQRQEGGPIEADEEEFGIRRNVARKKEEKKKVKSSKVYRGSKARKLYLQAWQHILWKQCHGLMKEPYKLKGELWNVVRDLWILRLSKVSHTEEHVEKTAPSEDQHQSLTESASDSEDEKIPSVERKSIGAEELPTLWESIALNYLGILLLQLPTTLATIYDGLRSEKICLIRAIRHIPKEMSSRLPSEYRLALDTTILPQPEDLQKAVIRLVTLFNRCFGMAIPDLNSKLILVQYLKSLALPLEVFPIAMQLAKLVRYSFGYNKEDEVRTTVTTCPEACLMSLVVISTKLMFPFNSDEVSLHPESLQEPTAINLDWTKWQDIKHKYDKESEETMKPGSEIEVTDSDVLNMQLHQLDHYMDWFQRTWIQPPGDKVINQGTLDMFPLQELPLQGGISNQDEEGNDTVEHRLRETQASLSARVVVNEDEKKDLSSNIFRPGQQYQQFRKIDLLRGASLAFHKEAANTCCISIETLLRAVMQAERKLVVWQHESRRREMFPEHRDKRENTAISTRR